MRIIYVLMTDWDWIKQRPQYLAEVLSKKNDILVLYPHNWWRKDRLPKNNVDDSLKLHKLPCLPKYRSSKIMGVVTSLLQFVYFLACRIRFKPEYIWIEHPDQYFFSKWKGARKVIYDCMDNYVELEQSHKRKKMVEKREKKLIRKTDIYLASSEFLRNSLSIKYKKYKITPHLVRNGFNTILDIKRPLKAHANRQAATSTRFRIFYIGTISDWFDWEVITRSLADFDSIEYHIIGPVSGKNVTVPNSERIIIHGPIANDQLHKHIDSCDLFCMPFKVNSLIEGVDPVKLYEYINFHRNVICVNYKEVERFEKFCFHYDDYEQFISILKNLIENNEMRYTLDQRTEFLEKNTWEERAQCITRILK